MSRRTQERPNIFQYHDYREFLRNWLAYLKASQLGFSLRELAHKSGISVSNISMCLSGSRNLSHKSLIKLGPSLGLKPNERNYLENMITLGNADSQEVRVEAFRRMNRFPAHKKNNTSETEVFRYLTHWYYVAIREMAALPDFSTDPSWIQTRLRFHVEIKDIQTALDFLLANKYLEKLPDGTIRPPQKPLDCRGGVYRLALTQFYQEMLALAGKSIENTPNEKRSIQSYTLAVDNKNFDAIRKILDRAYEEVRTLAQESSSADSIYHLELALFPLTREKGEMS